MQLCAIDLLIQVRGAESLVPKGFCSTFFSDVRYQDVRTETWWGSPQLERLGKTAGQQLRRQVTGSSGQGTCCKSFHFVSFSPLSNQQPYHV
jgi:hypothetical protein